MVQKVQFYIFILMAVFTLASCGAKKKTYSYGSPDHKPNTNTGLSKSNTAYYADILGVNPKELNDKLYRYIDEWMGAPHRLGGMSKAGIDCSGFVNMAFQQVYDINLPRTSREMSQRIKRKYDDKLREGDLVFFSFGGKDIDHVGIYLHNGKFVHVSTKQGVVISNLKDAWFYKYLTRCGTPTNE